MRNIVYVTFPSVVFSVYLLYNYYKDKYVKLFAYDKYKYKYKDNDNENNKINKINNIENIEYHCVETYYRFYTEYKKYFYDENGEINQIEINYKYKI